LPNVFERFFRPTNRNTKEVASRPRIPRRGKEGAGWQPSMNKLGGF
jgi:hypothetical protein